MPRPRGRRDIAQTAPDIAQTAGLPYNRPTMERADRAARDAILQRVYPDLRYGDDPDIDRYFELRAAGRVSEALSVYNRSLRSRYPDDGKRILLLNLYRRRDPRFEAFHDELLWNLYEAAAARLRANLDTLCAPLAGVPLKNTYRILKAVERLVGMLPPGRDAVLDFLDAYGTYADILGYRTAEIRRIRYLAGEYFDQASDREPDETDFLARSRAAEEKKQERRSAEGGFFDLSKIEFSPRDVERVEIPAAFERKEDQVLAFCFKYWQAVGDPAFERIVFLYSRKYGTPHYDVLRAIKVGRARKLTDDEILNRVSTALSSRYSYSVQGDLYMQQAWRGLKARLLGLGPSEPAPTAPEARSSARSTRPAAAGGGAAPASPGTRKGRPVRERPSEEAGAGAALRRVRKTRRTTLAPRPQPEPLRIPTPRGSVSDRIKALTGRRYDVYREEFLARSGPAIRAWLSARREKPKDVFADALDRAEDIVQGFLERNYANPYMDWENSEDRSRVEGLGFSAPDLDGIIALWYEKRGP